METAHSKTLAHGGEIVVLLHGIGHRSWNMWGAERALKKAGYQTLSLSYPSRKYQIADLAINVGRQIDNKQVWETASKVHFVTHSMGGLVARQYLSTLPADRMEKLGRVVMIAPPANGSEIADSLRNFKPYRWLFGPAGQELCTDVRALDTATPTYPNGVIAGYLTSPVLRAHPLLPGLHDGKVSVFGTYMRGMTDHVMLRSGHSIISWKPATHQQMINFLENGAFKHEDQPVRPAR